MKILVDAIFPPRESELRVRACSKDKLGALLSPMSKAGEGLEAIGLLPYAHEDVQACIIEAKFHAHARATQLLGHVLHEYLLKRIIENEELPEEKIILVPIPLSRARYRSRGYNQTERIAKCALVGLETYVRLESSFLVRTRDTIPQTTLGGDARRKNIIGAFAVSDLHQSCNPSHTYIVFDDVSTTGATIDAAIRTLTKAGARYVSAVALAH